MKPFESQDLEMHKSTLRESNAEESLLYLLSHLSSSAPDRVLMRHKRAGIWHCWSRQAMRDLAARQAAALAKKHIGPGARVAIIGENQPELYAAIIAAQGLGADVIPINTDFLRRFGMPDNGASLAICADEASARWWQGESVLLEELAAETEMHNPGLARAGNIILHDAGREARPVALTYRVASLRKITGQFLTNLPGGARLISFLPISSLEDAALSLVAPLTHAAEVNCVEGPATFPLDLREVAPDALVGPARMWELIDRDISRRLGGINYLKSATRPSFLFSSPLKNTLGLARCKVATVSSGVVAPGVYERLRALGIELARNGATDPESTLEAALRDNPLIDRARVWRDSQEYCAELSTRPAEAARLIDEAGAPALKVELNKACVAAGITNWQLRESGFAAHELTLFGDTRHISTIQPTIPAAAAQLPRHPSKDDSVVLMDAQGISLAFGGVKALTDVSVQVRKGEILSIIGPNGAGKTSFLNTLNGIYTPQKGQILFNGQVRKRMRAAEAATSGIGRTFQHVALFPGLNVINNIVAGRAGKVRLGFPGTFVARALRLPSVVQEESAHREFAEKILDFLDLTPIRTREVSTLPYGVQKRVELGRALAGEPSILLLDEPMAGMTQEEKQDMCRFIRDANSKLGTTIVLIEHDIGVVMGLSDRVVVLNYGQKIADGTPEQVRADPEVIRAYLGTGANTESGEG